MFDLTSPDNLTPAHLAYLAAAVLLPVRLLIIARATQEVPRLHARARQDGTPDLRRSTNPYADLAHALTSLANSGLSPGQFDAAAERTLGRAKRRTARGQALDAGCLLLLLGLILTDGTSSPLGPGSLGAAGFIGLMLVLTMIARAELAGRLDLALREFTIQLRQQLGRRAPSGRCAFCGADALPVEIEIDLDGAPTKIAGSLCRKCGTVVGTLPNVASPP
jgi:hypothetical protein